MLTLRKVGSDPTPGNDRLSLKATAALPAGRSFVDLHPNPHGARLLVREQPNGNVILDTTISPGVFSDRGSAG